MLITNLKLQNFRNYNQLNLDFNKNINIIYGDNAQGKTNILEAIFVSSIGKSFRTNKEKELIKIESRQFCADNWIRWRKYGGSGLKGKFFGCL